MTNDTIAAQATPRGRGGVSVIRVSGPRVQKIIQAILRVELPPRQAVLLPFRGAASETLDIGIAIFYPNPHSFTGEDVLELQGHGGPVIVDLLLQRILSLDARLARPGEFSERAFLNNKIDLTQAEAISDLINASSQQAARSALRSLQGEFSKAISVLNEKITYIRMIVEAAIDFSDEELDLLNDEKMTANLKAILNDLTMMLAQAEQGSFLREGINAVIAGEANVGKSSLLNCLTGKELAIVTNIPGTTRDVLQDYILIDGMPVRIVDTAGLRKSNDLVEQEGIRRAEQEIEQADVILLVTDTSSDPVMLNPSLQTLVATYKKKVIFIRNKIDLTNTLPRCSMEEETPVVSLSAKSGAGIDMLKDCIKTKVGYAGQEEGIFLARRRHLDALQITLAHLKDACNQLADGGGAELIAEDLRLAQHSLSEITGEFTSDDLLGKIFSSFCIGK
jgi:tRNA modification GTPase